MEKNTKIKVKFLVHGALFIFILSYLLLTPYMIEELVNKPIIYNFIKIVSIVMITFYILKYGVNINIPLILIMLNYLILIFSTYSNRGLFIESITNSLLVILLCIFMVDLYKDKELMYLFIKILKNMTLLIFIINIIISLVFPEGLKSNSIGLPEFLYGNLNSTIKYIFPGLISSFIIDRYRSRTSVTTIIFIVGMLLSIIFIYSMATSLIALLFISLWLIFEKYIRNNINKVMFIILFFIVLFQLLVVLKDNDTIGYLVTNIFNKNITFSGRRNLWDNTLYAIKNKPIIGYGIQSKDYIYNIIGNSSGSHNYFLDITFQRGIIGLSIFIINIILIMYKSVKVSLNNSEYILLGSTMVYLIMFLSEPFYNTEKYFIPLFYILEYMMLYKNNTKTN